MSEEFLDEISAMNCIFGEGTLVSSLEDDERVFRNQTDNTEGPVYILTLPDEISSSHLSLRLRFSPQYPATAPPFVLGMQSAAGEKRGTAARGLEVFRAAVGEVYEPGQVCLFDAIERLRELLSLENDQADSIVQPAKPRSMHQSPSPPLLETLPSPGWTVSDPVIELKSTFLARCCPVTSPSQAHSYLRHLLSTDKRVRSATHNMTAWRIRGAGSLSYQDCDDDGEQAAGGRLLHLMQLMDLWDVMVVVTRWFGGLKLGPRRFALINAAARDAFTKAGMVVGHGPRGPGPTVKKKAAQDK